MTIASVRILRLAVGTALSLWCSQAVSWQLSFLAPVFTMFILALPMPAPSLKTGIGLIATLTLSLFAGLTLLPPLLNQPLAGLLLLTLALYWSFYFTARGGSPLLGSFATIGIAVSTAIGTVNIDAVLAVVYGVSFAAIVGVSFVWIAHAALPDAMAAGSQQPAAKPAAAPAPELAAARRSAFRSLLIVLPVALLFLFSSASAAYVPVLIKVAAMGQQASNEGTRLAARSLLMSTIIGGIAAIIAWQVLSIAPILSVYTLLVALAALVAGPMIFQGRALHPQAATWSYGLLTMLVILAPAAIDSIASDQAGSRFLDRLWMFAAATLYAVVAVQVFDAFAAHRQTD